MKELRVDGVRYAAGRLAGLGVENVPRGQETVVPLGAFTDRKTVLNKAGLSATVRVEPLPRSDCLYVTGVVQDTRGTSDRAVDVVFRLPFRPALWWPRISEAVWPRTSGKERPPLSQVRLPGAAVLEASQEADLTQDALPVGCVTDPSQRTGVAIAIPPDFPCRFRFAYLRERGYLELTMMFGLSSAAAPELKSRAPFRFVVMPVDGRWALRDALRHYYALFPKSFVRRTQASGLWLFSVNSLKQVPDLDDYAFWEGPRLNELKEALAHKIESFPYVMVGQREITHLKDKPDGYQSVLAVLRSKPLRTNQTADNKRVDHPKPLQSQPASASTRRSGEVRLFVRNSGLRDPAGRWVYKLRHTDWGGESVTFPVDPSPFLSKATPTVADAVLGQVQRTLRAFPAVAGIYVDSLATWGSFNNYRRDQFAAARAPLSHDDKGRVCIPNWMPEVDFLRALRRRIGGRLVFGNGMRPGCAFCAFASDILGVETSIADLRSRRNVDFYRSVAGPKPFLALYYPNGELARTTAEEYVQRFVAMGLSPEVATKPWGRYKRRDADLYAKFLPLYRRLDLAGWQPVTHATAESKTVWVERFGVRPPELYFTLYNPSGRATVVRFTADLRALHLSPEAVANELVEKRENVRLGTTFTLPGHSLRVLQFVSH